MTKTKRFEIFKRDGFTCQYCGSRPPDVVLEVDHIHPQSKQGDDDEINLTTSCADCNRGKGARLLGERAIRPDTDLAYLKVMQEVAEAQRYLKAKEILEAARNSLIESICETWQDYMHSELCGRIEPQMISPPSDACIGRWLLVFSPEKIEEAIRIGSCHLERVRTTKAMAAYVSGILWNIRKSEERQPCPAPEA